MSPARWRISGGEGPLLVLVHAAGANVDVWEPVLPAFGGFDVRALSLPGREGAGDAAFARATDTGEWLRTTLDELGGPPALVLGHSYGGAVALEATLAGAHVAGLILVSTGARLRVHRTILELAEAATRGGEGFSHGLAFDTRTAPETVDTYVRATRRTPPAATLADWKACDSFDAMSRLSEVKVPSLVIGGTADALTPEKYHRYLAANLPRASLELMDGGHMLPWEAPEEVARRVRSWAAGVGMAPPASM